MRVARRTYPDPELCKRHRRPGHWATHEGLCVFCVRVTVSDTTVLALVVELAEGSHDPLWPFWGLEYGPVWFCLSGPGKP